jgi:MGT family glycosyltransferase
MLKGRASELTGTSMKRGGATGMHRHHIAFFVPPAHGHINPTLRTVSDLIARGHRVTYATPERFAPTLRDIGAEVVTYEARAIREGYSNVEDVKKDISVAADDFRSVTQAHEFYLHNMPSVLVWDSSDVTGAFMSQELPSVPEVRLFPSFAYNDHVPASALVWNPPSNWMERCSRYLDALLPGHDIGAYMLRRVAGCNVAFFPRFFQYDANRFDDRFIFVGPSIAKRPFYGSWQPSQRAKRLVLISLGTALNVQVEFFRTCIRAMADLQLHVVMTVGKGVDIGMLDSIPSNVEVHSFVPHLDVLPYASVYVGHGGMNSTMEALYHGVPLLLTPQDERYLRSWRTTGWLPELDLRQRKCNPRTQQRVWRI